MGINLVDDASMAFFRFSLLDVWVWVGFGVCFLLLLTFGSFGLALIR